MYKANTNRTYKSASIFAHFSIARQITRTKTVAPHIQGNSWNDHEVPVALALLLPPPVEEVDTGLFNTSGRGLTAALAPPSTTTSSPSSGGDGGGLCLPSTCPLSSTSFVSPWITATPEQTVHKCMYPMYVKKQVHQTISLHLGRAVCVHWLQLLLCRILIQSRSKYEKATCTYIRMCAAV